VAIPRLLDMLAIEDAIVTIDAMGCQSAIAAKIVESRLRPRSQNQPGARLHYDVALFVAEQKANGFKDTAISREQSGRRPWPHRDPDDDRDRGYRLAQGAPSLARP